MIVLPGRAWLAAVSLLLAPLASLTGQTAVARVAAAPASAAAGSVLTVNLRLDLTRLPAPDNRVGAYDGYFRWNPAVLQYRSKLEPSFGNPLTNESDTDRGQLRFANFSSSGPAGEATILTVTFAVLSSSATSPLDIDVQSVSSGSLATLPVRNEDGTFTPAGPATTPPQIGLEKTAIAFAAMRGASNPAKQTFKVSNAGGGSLAWSVSDDAAWLTASPASGSGEGTVTLAADAGGLAAGTHKASVTVAASEAGSKKVAVTFTVTDAPVPPGIGLDVQSLAFSAQRGGPNPQPQRVQVSNAGGGTLTWSVTDDAGWLDVSPPRGTNGGAVTVSVNARRLAAGTHTGTVTISAGQERRAVQVTLSVTSPTDPPGLALTKTALYFTGTRGQPNPTPQSFQVRNTGGGTLSWNASTAAAWLSLSKSSGVGAGAVDVTPQVAGLPAGTHAAEIVVSSPGLRPQKVSVMLTLRAAQEQAPGGGGGLALSADTLVFDATLDGLVVPQQVALTTSDARLRWTVSVSKPWLQVTPTAGRGPATLTILPVPQGQDPGTFRASLEVAPDPASGAPRRTIAIVLEVSSVTGETGPAAGEGPGGEEPPGDVPGAGPDGNEGDPEQPPPAPAPSESFRQANIDRSSPGSERRVDGYDVVAVLVALETGDVALDLNGDGRVDGSDLVLVLSMFGRSE